MPISQINLVPIPDTMEVLFNHASDVLNPGYAVAFNQDKDATTGDMFFVEKPTTANLVLYTAGIVVSPIKGDGTDQAITIVPYWWMGPNIEVFTDKNCTAGDPLGVLDATYLWNTYSSGRMRFICTQTVDRSTTNGLVRGILINQA